MTTPADPGEHGIDGLLALLDAVSDRVDTLGALAGDDGEAQENRTIHHGRAHLARSEARQVRDEVAEVRRRARVLAAQARAIRAARPPDAPAAPPVGDLLTSARATLAARPAPAGPGDEERLVAQARHAEGSVRWAQLCRPTPSGLASWSDGYLPPDAVAAVEAGPRDAVLAGADAVLVNETDEHWAAVRAAASRYGVRSVLGLAVADGVLVLASARNGTFDPGTPGRVVATLVADHVTRALSGEPGAAEDAARTHEALDGGRAVLGRHFGIDGDATFDALLEVARGAHRPVVAVAGGLLAALVPQTAGGAAPELEPVPLRRAVAYVDENAGHDIGLDDIVASAGIGDRRLQQLFRSHRGSTPLEYLRRVRLDRAHAELEAVDPTSGATVGDIATRWQFTHPGRFSIAYRERFGCSPSVTLRSASVRAADTWAHHDEPSEGTPGR